MITKDFTVSHHKRNISARLYAPDKELYPIVIFSHGFNGCGDDFTRHAKYLADNGVGAVTLDFCGGSLRSRSSLKTEEMTVFTEKEDLCAVIDFVKSLKHTDADNIFLFGASMGGLVSALTADERTRDIRGLILLYPALCVADDWNRRFPDADSVPEIFDVWGVPLGKEFFKTLHSFDVFENIGKYRGGVLIMHGDKDEVVPFEYGSKADKLYQNSRFVLFCGEGHGFTADADKRMTQMLLNFVRDNILQ